MKALARGEDAATRTRRITLLALLVAVFALRAWGLERPVVENFVGRQIPTAMVAKNLSRGSGFLRPQLDTGPFPNLFLVEPPIAAQVAAWTSAASGLPLDAAGRLVSASGTTLAAWGLFGLMVRRRGRLAAVAAVVAFASFPVTIRYGRAFQPDALTLGLLIAGLNFWDSSERGFACIGAAFLALGLAQKVTWGLSTLPPLWVILAGRPARARWLALGCIVPAFAWYGWASFAISAAFEGSSASSDNAWNWLARLSAPEFRRLGQIGRDLAIRSFTPVALPMVLIAFAWRAKVDRLWWWWMIGGGGTLLLLLGKLHHDYYWLMLSPAVAGGVGIAVATLAGRSRGIATFALGVIAALGMVQSRSTWTTPAEWRHAAELASAVGRHVPADALVIAPEAVIHLGDRRGCRLEWDPGAVRRAANEWRPSPAFVGTDPADLVAFYRRASGARYFADLDQAPAGSARHRLHEALRRDPGARTLEDRPGRYLLVEFARTD